MDFSHHPGFGEERSNDECHAFHILCGVKAIPVAMGGVGSGAGAVTLVLQGDEAAIEEAWHTVSQIKGEPVLENLM